MMITLEMGPDFQQATRELSGMGRAIYRACSKGLAKGVKIAAGTVVSEYLTNQSLRRRTGNLARAVQGWMVGDLEGVVGVQANAAVAKYAWLLGDESKTIVPKNAKFLAIPIGENLTGAGVPKFTSPRQVTGGFFVRTKGHLLFGTKQGKRGKFRALFTLVKSVFVQGTGALYDGVMDSRDDITNAIQTEIDKAI